MLHPVFVSGTTLFVKAGHIQVQQDKVLCANHEVSRHTLTFFFFFFFFLIFDFSEKTRFDIS